MWKHWVARSCHPHAPFKEFESAQWFWKRLGELFPELVSAVLMPNHFHLILPASSEDDRASRVTRGLLGAISVRTDLKKLWQPIPDPAEIPDVSHLRRQIRYVALNPCRKGLCLDPLEWYWSTHRDTVGAAAESHFTGRSLARILKERPHDFEVRFHSYVSGDPSVSVIGTPFPQRALPQEIPEISIGEILAAAAGALRVKSSEVQRRSALRVLFIHLAHRQGLRKPSDLAQICRISTNAVRLILNKKVPDGISAAELCLGDHRLRLGGALNFAKATVNRGTSAKGR